MSTLTISIFLIPLALFLVLFFAFSAFNLFHLFHYGSAGKGLYVVLTVYICGTLLVLGSGYLILAPFNWDHPLGVEEAVGSFDGAGIIGNIESSLRFDNTVDESDL